MDKGQYLCYGFVLTIIWSIFLIIGIVTIVISAMLNPLNLFLLIPSMLMNPFCLMVLGLFSLGVILLIVGLRKGSSSSKYDPRFFSQGGQDVGELAQELVRLDSRCPHCKQRIDLEILRRGRCDACGQSFDPATSGEVTCAHCGAIIPRNVTNCSQCGKPR
jgi:DNA-directed RNA polymerase subunit RPC12/RpoP